ncbi:MAG: hypothetical protein GXY53_07130 [Desulfobulbus sp.]|nr:hypothetical protein [Desulfobulbus sp.]
MNRSQILLFTVLSLAGMTITSPSRAIDFSYSAFGTIGAAISDEPVQYQRDIDDHGTFMRDSLLGGRLDARFNEKWAATTQVVLAASDKEDDVIKPHLKWTMVSYRPANDWLIRAGRLSLGGLLHQQNLDVGVTYDMARLPREVYLLSSDYDFDGVSVTKTWNIGDYELALDGSFGMQKRYYRTFREGRKQASYYSADVTGGGLVATLKDYDRTTFRFGWHITDIDPNTSDGMLTRYNFIPLGGGTYTINPATPFGYSSTFTVNTLFLGAEFPLGDFQLTCEGTAILPNSMESAPETYAGYISLSRKFDRWTPYITYARIWNNGLDTWRRVKSATNPYPPGSLQAILAETLLADAASTMAVFNQSSVMLGTSYALTPQQKIKAEVMVTHVGERSSMFDGDLAHENVTTFSLSYNFAF